MSRTNISVRDEVYADLEALKRDDESWSDLLARLAAADQGNHTQTTRIPAEQVEEIARATGREVEDRMTRR